MSDLNMTDRLQAFVDLHPDGWDHDSWLTLLASLEGDGMDVSNPEDIGRSLERTRLASMLRSKSVQGLGPKRIQAVVDRYGSLWNLNNASADDIAEIPTIPAALARKLKGSLDS